MLAGSATVEETNHFAQKHCTLAFHTLHHTGLAVSKVGFGAYRIEEGNDTHADALTFALQNGINLIDTSSNYGNGRSEQLIGKVMQELVSTGALTREEIVVVSKAGYLQGDNYELAQQRKAEGRPFPNIIKYSAGLDHCIHPEFLEDQLTRSLDRLKLESLDIYLLHNPEYYLSWAKNAKIDLAEARQTYYQRIKLAFEHLEKEVENGRIGSYGVSSNTFPSPKSDFTFSSLERMWQIAQEISPNHHFRTIQLPMNLYETGAASEETMFNGDSTLAFAYKHQINVLINRPLNAFYQDQLIRLADVIPPSYPTTVDEVSTMVDSLVAEERFFQGKWLSQTQADDETKEQLRQYLALGQMLEGKWQGFGSYQNWRDIQSRFLVPRAQAAAQYLAGDAGSPEPLLDWLDGYIKLFNETLAAVSAFYQAVGQERALQMKETAVSIAPDWAAETLSKTAVRALRSTEGVSCVLVGMRRVDYVHDMLGELANPIEQKNLDSEWHKLREMMTNS